MWRVAGWLAVAALIAWPCAGRAADQPSPSDGLTEIRSVGGVLDVTLVAAPRLVRLGDVSFDGAVFNGDYAGPVLRAARGETLRVRLVNHLAEPTNLHFHGIQGSPLGNGDNVHVSVAPGGSFVYVITIPDSQTPGLYWYHVHPHGLSERQVSDGLSGALIVEGLPAMFPGLSGVTEQVLVLKDHALPDDDDDDALPAPLRALHGVVQSINGQSSVTLTARPGQTQLWRFGNQSANRYAHLALQGHRFRVLARDGAAVTGAAETEQLDIPPAGRVEVLVEAGPAGNYELTGGGLMTGEGAAFRRERVLGRLAVSGEPATPLPPPTAYPARRDLRDAGIAARRLFVLSQHNTAKPQDQRFFIDGRTFDASRTDLRVPLGSIEEWTIRNDSDDMHVFHIHQVNFQVVAVNGAAVAFGGPLDVVRVPERGSVTIRLAFTDPRIVGRFMFHCHVLRHEDAGMMAQIEVYDPAATGPLARLWRFLHRVRFWLAGVPWAYCAA
jgi:FtsP/CotA-like multicopper oxidase with cupredoxin domain